MKFGSGGVALEPREVVRLAEALAEVYGSLNDLDDLSSEVFNKPLASIRANPGTIEEAAKAIVRHGSGRYEAHSLMLRALVRAPRHPVIRAFALDPGLQQFTLGSDGFQGVFHGDSPLGANEWIAGLCRALEAVGSLHVDGVPIGTAFLVAPDRIVTCAHVAGTVPTSRLRIVFDRAVHTESVTVDLDGAVLVHHAPCDPGEWQAWPTLSPEGADDICEFQLRAAVERQHLAARAAPKAGDRVLVLHHPGATRFLQVSFGDVSVVDNSTRRFLHGAATLGGSSGAPVLSTTFSVIGVHQGTRRVLSQNQAIASTRMGPIAS